MIGAFHIRPLILVMLGLLAAPELRAHPPVRGTIAVKGTGDPVAGAQVTASVIPQARTMSDSLGRFTLSLRTLPCVLTVTRDGYQTANRTVSTEADTVLEIFLESRTYDLDEVVVTTSRIPHGILASSSSPRVIEQKEIQLLSGGSLADLLSFERGLFVKDYGGPSALKTISQRGMGAEHTLLLLNGAPLNSIQNGFQDMGIWSGEEMERVEVIPGGQSASFGANAVAGVINVVTRSDLQDHQVEATTTMGSFGFRRMHLSASAPMFHGGVMVSASDEQDDGDFRFAWRGDAAPEELRRVNNDHRSRMLSLTSSSWWGSQSRLSVFGSYTSSERGVAGPVVSSTSSSRSRQTDRDILVQSGYATQLSTGQRWEMQVQYHDTYDRYADADIVVARQPLNTYFRSRALWADQHMTIDSVGPATLHFGSEGAVAWSEGNALAGSPQRSQWGIFALGEVRVLQKEATGPSLSFFPALRYDWINQGWTALSPQFGLQWTIATYEAGLFGQLRPALRASVSRNFRAPTFNELYFAGGGGVGNPGLLPERSTGMEAGADVTLNGFGEHHVGITAFSVGMDNRIVWIAAGSGAVTPKNLRNVQSSGTEVAYRWILPSLGFTARVEYSFSHTTKTSADYPGDPNVDKQLVYVPQEKGSITLSFSRELDHILLKRVSGAVKHAYVGFRYATEDNTDFLPSYTVTDIMVCVELHLFNLSVVVRGEVDNLFDHEYQVLLGYPMPSRAFRGGVGIML